MCKAQKVASAVCEQALVQQWEMPPNAAKHINKIFFKINVLEFRRIKIGVITAFFLLTPALCYSESSSSKLNKVLNKISAVQTDISQTQQKQTTVTQQLKSLTQKIRTLEHTAQTTEKNLAKEKAVLKTLQTNQLKMQYQLQVAEKYFATQIATAYELVNTPQIMLVFNQDDKIRVERLLRYHQYILQARLEQMHNIKKTIDQLALNQAQIQKQTRILETLEKTQLNQTQELSKSKQERAKLLTSLTLRIQTQNAKLRELLASKKNLENLINRLSPVTKPVHISAAMLTSICRQFVWPTAGTIEIHFGSPIEQSSWKWNGTVIAAPENQAIHAVDSGNVIYAGTLTGYGLLLIIDHGNGYMSLYGHNKSIYSKLGTKVSAGDIVATVGQSGADKPELYFAIRYNGKPVDPEKWCKH